MLTLSSTELSDHQCGSGVRVAHIMAGAAHGGAELFYERLCIALHADGLPILPVIRTNPARAALLASHGLPPVQLPFGGWTDVVTQRRLRHTLQAWRPDIVISWMNRGARHTPSGPWVRVGRLGGYYALRHYAGCDHLVGNTRGIADWLVRQGWPARRVHYLPNFVADFADAAPATDLPPLLRSGRRLLLGLGRLHTDKGFDTLLRALPALPGAVCAIAGEGPERRALERLAREQGVSDRVAFLGWRGDAGALLRAADVFVCSSRIEPLGNMVIEAWSAARPVVALAAAGPAELIADGRDGVLVPLEDHAALARAIDGVLANRSWAQGLADAGRRRFESDFTATAVIRAWRGFLERLAAAPLSGRGN